MDFIITNHIHIADYDIEEIANYVKDGVPFDEAFDDVISSYDDEAYYNRHQFYDELKEVVMEMVKGDE